MDYIKSTDIKVFPAAGRSADYPTGYLLTEDNLNSTMRSLYPRDFVIEYENSSSKKILRFVIHGYYFELNDVEDLFIWNDLVHAFSDKFHHKSILNDGSEVEWFWSWTDNLERHDDGYYYKSFGYRRVRVPIDNWHRESNYIPDKSIKTDIY